MKKKTHTEFINEMKNINPNIEILGQYKNFTTKIKCKCLIDGHIWNVKPADILSGRGCPECAKNRKSKKFRKTHEKFMKEVENINPNIEILEKYKDAVTKIKCRCLVDGYIWEVRPANILSGRGCPKCGGKINRTHEEFVNKVKSINPNVEILGKYKNVKTKVKCKCLIDGYIWEATPNNLFSGKGCPKCRASIGEKIVEEYCKKNYLQYVSQYRIGECRYKKPLPFDFALFNEKNLIALIEYQGKQHYEIADFAGKGKEWAEKRFNEIKKRDQIKRDYCLSKGIPLIEIPYWIEDVENYLEEQLDRAINKPIQLSLI